MQPAMPPARHGLMRRRPAWSASSSLTFKNGVEDQVARLTGKEFDVLQLSYRPKVVVRFEDGKAADFRW